MDILLKELRAPAILTLSGVHPEIFLTPLPPSVRGGGRCICANELAASQVKSVEWEEGKHLFLLFWESYKGTAISFNRFALWILYLQPRAQKAEYEGGDNGGKKAELTK